MAVKSSLYSLCHTSLDYGEGEWKANPSCIRLSLIFFGTSVWKIYLHLFLVLMKIASYFFVMNVEFFSAIIKLKTSINIKSDALFLMLS